MGEGLSKELLLAVYGCCRQAERSVDFALGSAKQWQGLRDYYDEAKRSAVRRVVRDLREKGAPSAAKLTRERLERAEIVSLVPWLVRWLGNRGRTTWRFSGEQVAFLHGTLERFQETLECGAPPGAAELIELRMDLHACETLIEQRLVGVADLETARGIEHFCQAPHLRTVSLQELVRAAA